MIWIISRNQVAGGLTAPSSSTTVSTVPYTAVHAEGASLRQGLTCRTLEALPLFQKTDIAVCSQLLSRDGIVKWSRVFRQAV